MRAFPSGKISAGRFANAFANPDPATGPPGNISLAHGPARADDPLPEFGRGVAAAFSRIEHAVVRVLHGLRDARDRRLTVRELRRLSPALLADIGIEPAEIEQIIDARFATLHTGPRCGADDRNLGSGSSKSKVHSG